MSETTKVIHLHDIEGFVRKSGIDEHGNAWIEDEVTEDPLECDICGEEIWSGWTCLDGGDFICNEHVEF
jgi:hypothetical protein